MPEVILSYDYKGMYETFAFKKHLNKVVFNRIDGNYRLEALEMLETGDLKYPFCIVLLNGNGTSASESLFAFGAGCGRMVLRYGNDKRKSLYFQGRREG